VLFRYSRWDGSQDVPDPDADDLLEAMSDDIMSDGDLWSAFALGFLNLGRCSGLAGPTWAGARAYGGQWARGPLALAS